MTSVEDFSKSQIALACWRAAKEELHTVMLCVCMVFQNRAKAGWYEGDVYENAVQYLRETKPEFPDTRDPQFQQMLVKLDTVLTGLVPDKTGGALYFYDKRTQEVSLPEPYKITTTIGNLVFVR